MKEKDFLSQNCNSSIEYYKTITPVNIHFVTTSTMAPNVNIEYIYK